MVQFLVQIGHEKTAISGFPTRYLYQRDGYYYFRRIIPHRYRLLVADKTEYKVSLGTNEPKSAKVRYIDELARCDQYFEELKLGKPLRIEKRFDISKLEQAAAVYDLEYKTLSQIQKDDDLEDELNRLSAWKASGMKEDLGTVRAT